MIQKLKNFLVAVICGALLMSSAGCFALVVGAAAGAGGYAWVKGALIKEFEVPAKQLSDVSIRAIKQLGMPLEEEKADHLSGYIRSKTADNQKVIINVKALTEKKSELKIRVGVFGDQAKSEMILNAVQKNLK